MKTLISRFEIKNQLVFIWRAIFLAYCLSHQFTLTLRQVKFSMPFNAFIQPLSGLLNYEWHFRSQKLKKFLYLVALPSTWKFTNSTRTNIFQKSGCGTFTLILIRTKYLNLCLLLFPPSFRIYNSILQYQCWNYRWLNESGWNRNFPVTFISPSFP